VELNCDINLTLMPARHGRYWFGPAASSQEYESDQTRWALFAGTGHTTDPHQADCLLAPPSGKRKRQACEAAVVIRDGPEISSRLHSSSTVRTEFRGFSAREQMVEEIRRGHQ